MKKVKPLTVEKSRRSCASSDCSAREVSQLRSLIGAMQWPASQCMVQGAATVSFSQVGVEGATVQTLLDANKSLRFLKQSGDVGLRICATGSFENLRLGVNWDASWVSRPSGESQGGHIIFAIDDERIVDGQPTPLVHTTGSR